MRYRQHDSECCAALICGFSANDASHTFYESRANGKAQSGALPDFFRSHKRLEDLIDEIRRNPRSIVGNADLDHAAALETGLRH